jgi:hypothetical protein
MPKSIRMKAIVKPTPGVDLLGPGHLVFVEPSPGKEWATHLRSALPRAPDWLIEVAKTKPAPTARPAKGPTSPPPPDELALYRKLLPDLRWGGTAGRAWCPLHVDDKASLALYIRGGRISWRCHAECEGSAQGRGGSHHGGNVRDLGRLIRISYGQTQTYERAAATAMMLEMSEEARKLLMAIISRARDHFIDLTDPSGIGFDYRSIARRTGIDEVVGITPERPAGWLKNNGRSIRKAIWELERLGLKVIPGTSHVDGQRGRRTAFVIPGIWFASNATPTASATPDDPDHLAHRPQDFQKPATDTPPATRDDPQPGPEAWGGIDILLSADLGVTCVRVVRPRTHVTGPHTCDTPGHTHVTGPKGQAEGQELREVFETPTSYWRERSFDHRLPPDEEAELVRRGMVTQAEVDAMDGLGPIPEGDEPDRLPALEVDGDV